MEKKTPLRLLVKYFSVHKLLGALGSDTERNQQREKERGQDGGSYKQEWIQMKNSLQVNWVKPVWFVKGCTVVSVYREGYKEVRGS